MKLDFVIAIRLLISFSHLASEENKLSKEMNDCTCSRIFPWTSIWHARVVIDLENTIEKDLALFRCNPFSSLLATTTLIKRCSCSSGSAKKTVLSAYLRLLTIVPIILKPSMFHNSLIIISVYKANKCGEATHPCRTRLMLIHALMTSPHLTAAV